MVSIRGLSLEGKTPDEIRDLFLNNEFQDPVLRTIKEALEKEREEAEVKGKVKGKFKGKVKGQLMGKRIRAEDYKLIHEYAKEAFEITVNSLLRLCNFLQETDNEFLAIEEELIKARTSLRMNEHMINWLDDYIAQVKADEHQLNSGEITQSTEDCDKPARYLDATREQQVQYAIDRIQDDMPKSLQNVINEMRASQCIICMVESYIASCQ